MIPALENLLDASAELYGIDAWQVRMGHDERCMQALGAFVWMAREATEHGLDEIALFAGRCLSIVQSELVRCELRINSDTPFEGLLLEGLYTVHVADDDARRRGSRREGHSPLDTAARVLRGRADAVGLDLVDYRRLAAAFLAQRQQIEALENEVRRSESAAATQPDIAVGLAVARAWRELESTRHSPHEKFSRMRLDTALDVLAGAYLPLDRRQKDYAR